MPKCLPAPTPARQALRLDRPCAGSVPTRHLARCLPPMARRSTSRAAGHALGGERLQGPSWQMVPTCRDRCRHVGTADGVCGHMTARARRRIMAPRVLARRPPQHDGAYACARAGSTAPVPTRWQATSRPPHGMMARSALGHTGDDGQDVVCDPGPRQTAVDDTHVATGRHRVVDAPGGGREHHDRRRRARLRRRG